MIRKGRLGSNMEPTLALDVSISKLKVIESEYADCNFMQLRTPLTQYKDDEEGDIPYILDNGAYTYFDEPKWLRMTAKGINDEHCKGIVMPDVVGDWTRTLFQFEMYKRWVPLEKRFIVLQDGCMWETIPWEQISGVFLGGTDAYKYSNEAYACLHEARRLDKWVHVGRVNTPYRVVYFDGLVDSVDGSGISRFDHMLEAAVKTIRLLRGTKQLHLDDFGHTEWEHE